MIHLLMLLFLLLLAAPDAEAVAMSCAFVLFLLATCWTWASTLRLAVPE